MTITSSKHPVVLVGAGKMGGAMLDGWLASGRAGNEFAIVDPGLPEDRAADLSEKGVRCLAQITPDLAPSAVILAVKPQMMEAVLPGLVPLVPSGAVFISVAAGKPISFYQSHLGQDTAIVRAMPNTPSQVGRGITIGFATQDVSADQKKLVEDLLVITGGFDWVDEEGLVDAVTAVSGSGPAYVFYMVEALAQAGRAAGLPDALALRLARATVEGAGELLYQSELDASTLRENVTSPGGTTAAALAVLMADDGMPPLMKQAVLAAKRRAEELAR